MSEVGEPLRVVFADDHPFYREGMSRMLRQCGIDVIAELPNAETALRAVAELAPDVVLMDLNMPGMSGIEAIRRLTAASRANRVLVLSVSADHADVAEALLAGACGYVLKDSPVEEIVAGIRSAAVGRPLLSPRVATVVSNQR
jgi:DNA-binding NarL/FixJ family response regulator